MKFNLFVVFTIVILNSCQGIKRSKNIPQAPPPLQLRDTYKVLKIDSIKNVYVVLAQRQSTIFKIVSIRDSSANCKRIKVDDVIAFSLFSIVDSDTRNMSHLNSIDFHGVSISLDSYSGRNIFITNNLTGLCLH